MGKPVLVAILVLILCAATFAGSSEEEETALDRLPGVDIPVQVHFKEQKLSTVIGAMAETAPFEVTFKDEVGDQLVSVNWEKQSLKQALVKLAEKYDLAYDVPSWGHLVVRKDTAKAETAER
jgi:type II secretory pathway component GspD/PulD (secretin)